MLLRPLILIRQVKQKDRTSVLRIETHVKSVCVAQTMRIRGP